MSRAHGVFRLATFPSLQGLTQSAGEHPGNPSLDGIPLTTAGTGEESLFNFSLPVAPRMFLQDIQA
jgi:hypothetical protein